MHGAGTYEKADDVYMGLLRELFVLELVDDGLPGRDDYACIEQATVVGKSVALGEFQHLWDIHVKTFVSRASSFFIFVA